MEEEFVRYVATPSEGGTESETTGKGHGGSFRDLSGKRFGKWTVVSWTRTDAHGSYFLCRCDCGTEKEVRGFSLMRGSSRSCGGKGCVTRNASTAPRILPEIPAEDQYIYRTWCELQEIGDRMNWRCRPDGSDYPIRQLLQSVKDWKMFYDWSKGLYENPEYNIRRQAYTPGKVLATVEGCPTVPMDQNDPDGPKGAVLGFPQLEWTYRQVAEGEDRLLVVKPVKEKFYHLDGLPGPAVNRRELSEKYDIPLPTLVSRMRNGYTTAGACLGSKIRKDPLQIR